VPHRGMHAGASWGACAAPNTHSLLPGTRELTAAGVPVVEVKRPVRPDTRTAADRLDADNGSLGPGNNTTVTPKAKTRGSSHFTVLLGATTYWRSPDSRTPAGQPDSTIRPSSHACLRVEGAPLVGGGQYVRDHAPSGLLETFGRTGVWPDSVQVLGGTLSSGLPARDGCGSTPVCSPSGAADEAWLKKGLPCSW
jgi:hypothetical protein